MISSNVIRKQFGIIIKVCDWVQFRTMIGISNANLRTERKKIFHRVLEDPLNLLLNKKYKKQMPLTLPLSLQKKKKKPPALIFQSRPELEEYRHEF